MVSNPAGELQERYWSRRPGEYLRLSAASVESLSPEEQLRLLHLACIEMISTDAGRRQLNSEEHTDHTAPEGAERDLVCQLLPVLLAESSPYRARWSSVWQGEAGQSGKREEDLEGFLRNVSVTHPGCLEVLRLDREDRPIELAFVPFDDLRGVMLGGPALFRYGKLFYEDGLPDEIVLVPLLYGLSWSAARDYLQDGSLTCQICNVDIDGVEWPHAVGVGHQDFLVTNESMALFGLGSVGEIMFALSTEDPRFEERCRVRGLDPERVIRETKRAAEEDEERRKEKR